MKREIHISNICLSLPAIFGIYFILRTLWVGNSEYSTCKCMDEKWKEIKLWSRTWWWSNWEIYWSFVYVSVLYFFSLSLLFLCVLFSYNNKQEKECHDWLKLQDAKRTLSIVTCPWSKQKLHEKLNDDYLKMSLFLWETKKNNIERMR